MATIYGRPPIALGGDRFVYIDNNIKYVVHVFKSSDTFISFNDIDIDCLIVGGGGLGGLGNSPGGGGGAGGLIYLSDMSINKQSYTVVVGGAGGNSSAFNYTALSGGAGSSANSNGNSGGSGGGAGGGTGYSGGAALQPTSTPNVGYGNMGGNAAGGGGGAGAAGGNGFSAAAGGVGLYYGDKFGNTFGQNGFFAGGGGGMNYGPGGTGGGGRGGTGSFSSSFVYTIETAPIPGLINTGGGGGSAHFTDYEYRNLRRFGGSGIVIIRYRT